MAKHTTIDYPACTNRSQRFLKLLLYLLLLLLLLLLLFTFYFLLFTFYFLL